MSNKQKVFMAERVLIKGAKTGYCRICQQYGKLTADHVPPKGSITLSPVALRTLGQNKKSKPVISQGGTNFRTLCGDCNNNLLGQQYDPELNKISKEVGSLVNKINSLSSNGFILPEQVTVEVKPQKLARAIIGHLFASNYHPDEQEVEKSDSSKALRAYFLDQNATLPDDLNIYYWFYPGNRQVLIRAAMMASIMNPNPEEAVSFGLIKFAPIAYMVTWQEPKINKLKLSKLFKNRNVGIDETEKLEINLRQYPSLGYPELPDDEDKFRITLFNHQQTSVAIKKKGKTKGFGK